MKKRPRRPVKLGQESTMPEKQNAEELAELREERDYERYNARMWNIVACDTVRDYLEARKLLAEETERRRAAELEVERLRTKLAAFEVVESEAP